MQGGTSAARQPFAEHLHELRRRVFYCLLILLAGSAIGYSLRGWLLHVLTKPLNQQLYYTSPLGGFNAVMKMSVLFGVVLMLPLAMYQIARFVSPAFRGDKQKKPLRLVLASLILAATGIGVGYSTSLPVALHFFTTVSGPGIQPLIVVNDYLNFVTSYLVFYAILFQLPIIMIIINRVKPQKPKRLAGLQYQRWVVLMSFILAAFLTPTPDPFSQILMAMPMILLWQVGVLAVWWQNRRQAKQQRKTRPAVALAQPVPIEPAAPIVQPRPLPKPRYFDIIPPEPPRGSRGFSSPTSQAAL